MGSFLALSGTVIKAPTLFGPLTLRFGDPIVVISTGQLVLFQAILTNSMATDRYHWIPISVVVIPSIILYLLFSFIEGNRGKCLIAVRAFPTGLPSFIARFSGQFQVHDLMCKASFVAVVECLLRQVSSLAMALRSYIRSSLIRTFNSMFGQCEDR